MSNKLSRRDFLKLSGVTSAGILLSACGVKAAEVPTFTSTPLPSLTPFPTAIKTPIPTPTKTLKYLRDFAEKIGFNIGVAVGGYGFPEYYNFLIAIQGREFNLGMVYLDMTLTEPKQNQFTLRDQDSDFSLTQTYQMKSLGHPLIWFDAVPGWVKNGKFSRDELIGVMNNHIITMMNHYKGKMNSWVVVNEAYVRPSDDIFYKTIGPEYVDIAFQTARTTDPTGILIYNEFDNHIADGRFTQHTRDIVTHLKSKNLVDAVGLQMHLDGSNPPEKQDVITTMKSYGIPVYVTEFDVNMRSVKETQDKRFEQQAQVYKDMLEAALESSVCKDFNIFGLVDKLSVWETQPQQWAYSPNANPLPWDDNFQPKPAYYAILDALKQHA